MKHPKRGAVEPAMVDTFVAAAKLGLAIKTLQEWRRRRCSPVPHYKIRGAVRYRTSELDAYLEQQRVAPGN